MPAMENLPGQDIVTNSLPHDMGSAPKLLTKSYQIIGTRLDQFIHTDADKKPKNQQRDPALPVPPEFRDHLS